MTHHRQEILGWFGEAKEDGKMTGTRGNIDRQDEENENNNGECP